ncbi:urea transporter [Nitzschia inconspicua]|uniref:Urea transporter n=1 Tax=Nitzschia inconspicua TaxID=303405 RepID=A0A9K3LRU8_9STRA|nr:urea transporter [Nitzschia inconspicua]
MADSTPATTTVPPPTPADDEKKESDGNDPSTAAAKQTLKDLIHITTPGPDADSHALMEGSTEDGDDWETIASLEKHPMQKAVEDITQSVRGGFETHVAPKVDEFVSNTQYLLDTHVVPHFQGVKEHSSRAVHEIQENTGKAVKGLQENTSKVVKGVQEHSSRAVQGLQEHSSKAVKGVQENTAKAWQATEKTTKEFHQTHVAPHLEKASVAAKEFHDTQIKPKVEKVISESTRALETTGSCLQNTFQQYRNAVIQNRPFYWNTAPDLFDEAIQPWYLVLEEGTARSFGQVVFCNNPFTGILVWLAILVASPLAALCSATSVIMTNLTGLYLDMDRAKLRQGLLASNSVLVGTSLVDYFAFDSSMGGGWAVQVFLSILLAPMTLLVTLWLQHKVLSTSTPVLLLPFNIIMLAVLLSAKVWDATMITHVDFVDESIVDESTADRAERYFGYKAVLNGVARIFLVDGMVAGAMILIGMFMCSRILTLAVVGGAFVSSLLSWAVFDVPTSYLNGGYAGFNPALAMAGIFFYLVPSWKLTGLAFFWLILTMIATGAVFVLLDAVDVPVAMSFGYCFALLPLLSLDPETVFGSGHTLIKRIPEADLSCPEEYLDKIAPPPVMREMDEEGKDDNDVEAGDDNNKTEEMLDVPKETTPLLSSKA